MNWNIRILLHNPNLIPWIIRKIETDLKEMDQIQGVIFVKNTTNSWSFLDIGTKIMNQIQSVAVNGNTLQTLRPESQIQA